MLDDGCGPAAGAAGSPCIVAADVDAKDAPSVSLRRSPQHASLGPGASPTISALDGTPLHLIPVPFPASLPIFSSTPPEMAGAPPCGFQEDHLTPRDLPEAASDPPPQTVASDAVPSSPRIDSPEARAPFPEDPPKPLPSLPEICRLLRLQSCQMRRSGQVQAQFHRLQIAGTRMSRLARTASSVQATLAECIRIEDKASFINLSNACHDAVEECSKRPSGCPWERSADPLEASHVESSFVDELSDTARVTILELLSALNRNGNFIADRFAALTQRQILALLPDRTCGRPGDSIFSGVSTRSVSRSSKPLGFLVDAQVDTLVSQAYSSPLETLVHAIQGTSLSRPSDKDSLTDIWATVSARMIRDQKPGAERLIPALLDIWSALFPWPGKDRLEVWIMRTIQQGASLLDQQSKQSFRARAQGRTDPLADGEARLQSFYNKAADSLLDLVSSTEQPSIIPPGALTLCRAISTKLQSSLHHQRAFPQFVLTRWLFSAFIPDAVTLPEACGMMTDFYISETARHRILREIAQRSQKAVFDVVYNWKIGATLPLDTVQRVRTVMARFQDMQYGSRLAGPDNTALDTFSGNPTEETIAVISVSDVATIVKALYPHCRPVSILSDRDSCNFREDANAGIPAIDGGSTAKISYPQRRSVSISSDQDTFRSGLYSSASSVSGFSMFRNSEWNDSSTDLAKAVPYNIFARNGEDFSETMQEASDAIDKITLDTREARPPLDLERIREAYIELDDLVANITPASSNFWAVLVTDPVSQTFCTLSQKCKHLVCTVEGDMPDATGLNGSAIEQSCLEAIVTLLQKNETSKSIASLPENQDFQDSMRLLTQQLIALFRQAIEESENNFDFVQAHRWFCYMQNLQVMWADGAGSEKLQNLLRRIEQTAKAGTASAALLVAVCEEWLGRCKSAAQLQDILLTPFSLLHERLRDKMWYVADVRTSASYDEARIVASALRVMGKPKKLQRTRVSPPLRHWAGPKLPQGNLHLKSEAQVLELLSTRPEHGGPNKLSDEQSTATSIWLSRQRIDNLCTGEERLHRLCMEIRKCVDETSAPPSMENSLIWANGLFARDRNLSGNTLADKSQQLLHGVYGHGNHASFMPLGAGLFPRPGTASSASQSLSAASSHDYLDARSPTLTNRSSAAFWSPAMTEVDSPSSATSVGSSHTQPFSRLAFRQASTANAAETQDSLDKLRQRLTSLLLSDLSITLFSDGSETDIALWTGLGRSLAEEYLQTKQGLLKRLEGGTPTKHHEFLSVPTTARFSFQRAFETLFARFTASLNPFTKLDCLADVERLLEPYMAFVDNTKHSAAMYSSTKSDVPQREPYRARRGANEKAVDGFMAVFTQSNLRPSSIFRDLQYIASLVPHSILEGTARGAAFFNAAVAITQLKREVCTVMVETADSIIAYQSNNRGGGRTSSVAQQQRDSAAFSSHSRTSSAEEVSRYTMTDAAYLLQISAKEGDPVAQRELATLYLTNPELMEHIIQPFARPREVFKEELESKWRKNQDPNRCDPTTMCVAHHWMSLSSKHGDALATEYLRQREEIDRLP